MINWYYVVGGAFIFGLLLILSILVSSIAESLEAMLEILAGKERRK